jgi:hypothetical protein
VSAPLKIRPVLDPIEECHGCRGLGSVECEECHGRGDIDCECDACGHEHDRECRECSGEGRYACDACYGFACLAAAREWEQDMVLPLIPSDVLRGILRLAPHLDAAGLPHYSVRVEGCNARPVIRVEVRRDNAEAEALLVDTGVWQIERMAASEDRPRHRLWRYRGPAVRLDVKIATADGREVCGDCGAEVSR